MTNSNILAQIHNGQAENNTSAVLEYLLNGLPAFKEEFLRLVKSGSVIELLICYNGLY